VTTRYYRAPELYLNYDENYSTSVDMWSVGCIIAEMFNKKVFLKAHETSEYLEFLVEMLGLPSSKLRHIIKNKNYLKHMQDREPLLERKTLK